MENKTLILLDLDHTLIYGSFASSETAQLLVEYSTYLKVFERPHAKDFIKEIQSQGEIIVFTTAKEDYAQIVSEKLEINPIQLLSRSSCTKQGDSYKKRIRKTWLKKYRKIIIIDDSPQVWEVPEGIELKWIIPKEFRGDGNDQELLLLIEDLKTLETSE